MMTNAEELVQQKYGAEGLNNLLLNSLASLDANQLSNLMVTALGASTIPSAEKKEIKEKKTKTPRRARMEVSYCKICEKEVFKGLQKAGATAARKHIRKEHTKKRLFSCSMCEYSSCYDKCAVKTHIARQHGSVGEVLSLPNKETMEEENEWIQKCFGAKDSTESGQEEALETTQELDEEMPVLHTPPTTPSNSPSLDKEEKEETATDSKTSVFSTLLEEALWQQLQTVSAQNTMLINIITIQMRQNPL